MVIETITAFMQSSPRTGVILAALLVSLFVSLVNYFVLDKAKMHEIKQKQKSLQEEMKKHKDNPQKLMELQKEMFSHMGETMRHSIKPMLFTFIPLILLFPMLRSILLTTEIAKTWFWWYLVSSFIGSMIFRKLLKLP